MKALTRGLLAVVGVMTYGRAAAATYYVDNTLDDYTGADGSAAKPFKTIQAGVNKAVNGDTVLVRPGVYGEDQGSSVDGEGTDLSNANYSYHANRVWINNKHITLKSTDGADVTHIVGRRSTQTGDGAKGDDAVRCICFTGNANIGGTRVEGFTIRDGEARKLDGGVTLKNGTVCQTSHTGGGVLFMYTTGGNGEKIHVVDCVISNCVAAQGAAACGVSLIRSRIEKNYTGRASGSTAAQCNAANCIFADNGIVEYEGTLRRTDKIYGMTAVNCTFWNNKGMLQASSGVPEGRVVNCLIQRNASNNGNSITGGTGIWYCVTDVAGAPNINTNLDGTAINVYMGTRQENAVLAAPLFGDFRPVTETAATSLFNRGSKAMYDEMTWIPEQDRELDMAKGDRWDADGRMTAGAYQQGIAVGGGCLVITGNGCACEVDGRRFTRPEHGYFYAKTWPEQHRIRFTAAQSDVFAAWLGGYHVGWRFPDTNGDVIVTTPPESDVKMMCVEAKLAKRVLWVDAAAAADGTGTEQSPFQTIQDAVSSVKDSNETVIKVKAGEYRMGGADYWGLSRVRVPQFRSIQVRAVDGAARTAICGGTDETGEPYRCVAIEQGTPRYPVGFVGFTLKDGQVKANEKDVSPNRCYGGGFFSNEQDLSQLVDSVITNCSGVRASAAYKGWLQNCWIVGCRQQGSEKETNGVQSRGVVYNSYLSGCVVGPNAYATVCIDSGCRLWNVTMNEDSPNQPFSATVDSLYFNVLALNVRAQPNLSGDFFGCAIHTAPGKTVAITKEYTALDANPLADCAQGDFRPKAGTAVIGPGYAYASTNYVNHTIGGFYHEVHPAGRIPIGASSEVAVPVTVGSHARVVSVMGGLSTGYVSANYPLAFSLKDGFDPACLHGYEVNGVKTEEKSFVLTAADGVASYTVTPDWRAGLMIFVK